MHYKTLPDWFMEEGFWGSEMDIDPQRVFDYKGGVPFSSQIALQTGSSAHGYVHALRILVFATFGSFVFSYYPEVPCS